MSKINTIKNYIHGYTANEQSRLYKTAKFFEQIIYRSIDFVEAGKIIEIGCGVGGQTEILLRRFQHLNIDAIDASEKQLKKAKSIIKSAGFQNRVNFHQCDAAHLPFKKNTFDGAFVCWFLEHVSNPVGILKEAKRVLKPGAVIYCNEVLNNTFFCDPYSPAILRYWLEFNDYQWNMRGDPFLGAKLGNCLLDAGFNDVRTEVLSHHFDNRTPRQRTHMFELWTDLLLSAAPAMLESKRVDLKLVGEMKKELATLKEKKDAVFFLSWIQSRAIV